MSLIPPAASPQAVSLQPLRPAAPAEAPGLAHISRGNVNPQPPAQQIDAFSASVARLTAPAMNPDRIGRSIGLEMRGFNANETQFRANVAQAAMGAETGDTMQAEPVTFGQMMADAQKLERKSMGVMMQTYDFALEATLVTNAATTFTSSINTLIKTQ